ncbi:hypothetical protein ACU4GD_19855 [Cupriavidus basilensis]
MLGAREHRWRRSLLQMRGGDREGGSFGTGARSPVACSASIFTEVEQVEICGCVQATHRPDPLQSSSRRG